MATGKLIRAAAWFAIAVAGASALGGIALLRGESINALWFVVAAVCTYLGGSRFYSGWIAARVCRLDPTRATPAERLDNGRDFMPTHRSIVFGHHFAAIAGAGPLIGPTPAAQFSESPTGARELITGESPDGASLSGVRVLLDLTPLSFVQITRGSDRPHIVTGGTLGESRHAFDSPRRS